MIWLVQNALFGDEFGYDNFIAAIDATGDRRIQLDYTFWESTIDLKLTGTTPKELLPFGTRSFVCYAKQNGWIVYWDDAFEYPSLLQLGEEFINYDMTVGSLGDLQVPDTGKVYVREAAGFNIIKGKVISGYAWPDWVEGFKRSFADGYHAVYGEDGTKTQRYHDWHPITEDSLFVWAPVKTIIDEYRVWIVDGRVVTSSQYINHGDIKYTNSDENHEVNSYAQRIADNLPFNMRNYVLDVFRTEHGLKIGEINCLHCSGWYAIDSRKVVAALSKYHSS